MLHKTLQLVTLAALALPLAAQQGAETLPPRLSAPNGSFVLAGGGELPDDILEAFARLAGGGAAKIVLIGGKGDDLMEQRFQNLGIPDIKTLRLTSKNQVKSEKALLPLLAATGAWLASDLHGIDGNKIFGGLLRAIVARGGVVGGSDGGARALAACQRSVKKKWTTTGFDVLPRSVIATGYRKGRSDAALNKALQHNPGYVGWAIEKRAALILDGRRMSVVGDNNAYGVVPGRNGWEERRARIDLCSFTTRWDELPYTADFLSWTNSAREHCGPVFPPAKAPVPSVSKGTIMLHGGGGVPTGLFERFIAAAGGKNATIVCIPTGGSSAEGDASSYSERKLRGLGCENVFILHTRNRGRANFDRDLLEPLKKANGVWIDGGRTYRLMDAYAETKVQDLMRAVLERGGVVAGSSAGCQIQGDFLMRGKPGSNKPQWWRGYTSGFGFLRGVILDAHFRQRGRHKTLPKVMQRFPMMLGIGVDEKTTLIVKGHIGEVAGPNAVTFYDFQGGAKAKAGVILRAGSKFDLKTRKPLK